MSGERTEKATPQQLRKAYREGRVSRSADLTAWVGLAGAALALPMVGSRLTAAVAEQLARVRQVAVAPSAAAAADALDAGLSAVLPVTAPVLALAAGAALLAGVGQGVPRPRRLKVHVEHLNPVAGMKKLVGPQVWWQAAKTLLKTAAVAGVLALTVQQVLPVLMASGSLTLGQVAAVGRDGVTALLRAGIAAGVVLALADAVVVARRNRKHTRVTRQELKEEHKRSEGDPLLKGAIRSRQLATSRNRMMAAIADADVVLVNPTHVAVALRYVPGRGAPRVVAKGAGAVADRIRERAREHRVPMVEDVPLARALHLACDLDAEIPEELFTAVARVLAFVVALRRRGAAAGRHRLPGGSVAPDDLRADPSLARRHRRRRRTVHRPQEA